MDLAASGPRGNHSVLVLAQVENERPISALGEWFQHLGRIGG